MDFEKKKFLTILIILLISICFLSINFAENNYITPITINKYNVTFSNGLTGFPLDTDNNISLNDTFTQSPCNDNKIENYAKLIIIEGYKEENINIGEIIYKIINDDLNNENTIINEVLNSNDKIKNHEVLNISNDAEATFDFKILNSSTDKRYLTYTVSLKNIEPEKVNEKSKLTATKNKTVISNETTNNTNNVKTTNNTNNKTITNKTTTIIVNETNTTIINNVKTINKTTDVASNNTTSDLLKKTGNPIIILIIVIVILATVIVKRRY